MKIMGGVYIGENMVCCEAHFITGLSLSTDFSRIHSTSCLNASKKLIANTAPFIVIIFFYYYANIINCYVIAQPPRNITID